MPHEITYENLPLGHAASASPAGQESVNVQSIDFTSSVDGQLFIKRLEQRAGEIVNMVRAQCDVLVSPSQVDHLLAVVRRDRTATVHINEIPQTYEARFERKIEDGEIVSRNDVVEIGRMVLGKVEIPRDAGVVFLFSVGWRKGLFYDFLPLKPDDDVQREYDCSAVFGQLVSQVLFQERFSIDESEWRAILDAKLFPFAGLRNETIQRILGFVRAGWDLAGLSDEIVKEVRDRIHAFLEAWQEHPVFSPHMGVLKTASERFLAGDDISCIGTVVPRIEGVLRSHHVTIDRSVSATQASLASSAVAPKISSVNSSLLPHRFREYLRDVYFANFDSQTPPGDSSIELSRNSVGHGVAPSDYYTATNAAIAFLVLHQLFYIFGEVSGEDVSSSSDVETT